MEIARCFSNCFRMLLLLLAFKSTGRNVGRPAAFGGGGENALCRVGVLLTSGCRRGTAPKKDFRHFLKSNFKIRFTKGIIII